MGLASAWSGRPHWFMHGMALGETLGDGTRLTQNNRAGLYKNQIDTAAAGVHVALMGDPTLRMHAVAPPSGVKAAAGPAGVELAFDASSDAVLGYHVYRASTRKGPFARVTAAPVTTTRWTDAQPKPSEPVYMVRAVLREVSGSGTYLDASQGIVASVDGTITAPHGADGAAGANGESLTGPGADTAGADADADGGCALGARREESRYAPLLMLAALVLHRTRRRASGARPRA